MSGSRRRRGEAQALRTVTQASIATSNQFEYIDGQLRPSQAALFEQFAGENERAVSECQPELDIAYGQHPRQTSGSSIGDLYRRRRGSYRVTLKRG